MRGRATGALDAARIAHALEARRPAPPAERPNQDVDRELLASLFEAHRGNVSHVARALGTSRSQVRRLAERFGLVPEQFRR